MAGTLWYLQGTSLAPPVHALQGEGQASSARREGRVWILVVVKVGVR